jgi:outer membrane protein TolC
MRVFVNVWILVCLLTLAGPARAQVPLTIEAAMRRARVETADAAALLAAEREAGERIRSAWAGYLPRVDLSAAAERGNQPVFVFGALLAQRRFTDANFAVSRLNQPDPVTNVRLFAGFDQSVFDGGSTRAAVRGARLGREIAGAAADGGRIALAFAAAEAFVAVLRADAAQQAADAAVAAAESDRQRAGARQQTGLSTPADVLAIEVHLADARGRAIAARSDKEIARLRLALAIGADADPGALVRPQVPDEPLDVAALVAEGLRIRPEVRRSEFALRLAAAERESARASRLPRLGVNGGVEFNGSGLSDQQSSWIIGTELRVNVFNGFRDASRVAAARQAEIRARAERDATVRRVELEVREAVSRVHAARAREKAGRAALDQAREAQRIVRDRYETGLATVTDSLRAAEAVLSAQSQATAAEMDVILQTLAVDRAVGRLAADRDQPGERR